MPSTYSPDLRIELIANGEQSGVWGTTTNTNLGTIIEDAISGSVSIVTSTQKYALLAANGAADQARCAMLVLDTTYVGAGDYEVYAPPVTKLYVVRNASTTKDLDLYCATAVNGTTAAGAAYTIPIGKTAFVRSNGTQFFDATDYISGSVSFTNAVLTTPSLSGETFSTAASVVAGTNLQGQGALTADYNIVTTTAANPSGVTLPTATTGRRIIIVNKGTNAINVFPATGAAIDALSTNASISIPIDGVLEFNAASTTRWYSYSALTLTSPLITTPSLVAAKVSTTANITAGANTQGQGALTSDYNVITTAGSNPSGVTLPTATVGRKVLVVNKGANSVNVYPATGAAIDALGANVAIALPVNGVLEFNASSITQWYSSYNATTPATFTGVSFTGTQPTASVNQVAVYGATGTSITTGRTYQFRSTTAGSAQIQLFENTTNGTNSVIIQPPAALAADYTLTLPADDGTANQVLQTDGTGVLTWATVGTGNVNFTGTAPVAGQMPIYTDTTGNSLTTGRTYQFRATSAGQAQIQLYENTTNGTNSVTVQPPALLAADYTLTLPTTAPASNGQVLTGTTTGDLSWANAGGTGTVTSVATGTGLTGGPITTTGTISLANTAVTPGSYTAANITVDAQGRITAAASGSAGGGTVTSVASGNGMNFTTITGTGTVTMGTPSAITSTSTNSTTATSHTHAITGAAFLAGTQTFTGTKTFLTGGVGGIISAAYNFTATNESIYGVAGEVGISTGGTARVLTTNAAFRPSGDNNYTLGASGNRWSVVYAGTGTINTSDAETKQDIADLDDAEKRVALRIKGLIKKFRFKDAVAAKGSAARIHVGVIAQEVQDAFSAEGLNADRYGLFCSDTWWEEEVDEPFLSTEEIRRVRKVYDAPVEGAVEKTRLGVRYEELLAFVIAAM